MVTKYRKKWLIKSVRPLVRYVDEDQAVINVTFQIGGNDQADVDLLKVHMKLVGPHKRIFTHQTSAELDNGDGAIHFSIGEPQRWWPAGMGGQELYSFTLTLLAGDKVVDKMTSTLGMTSVRTPKGDTQSTLLVNGRQYEYQSVVSITPDDEKHILPVGGDSLLVIQDHFGPDVLFDAADRAGILLIQSVPLSRNVAGNSQVRQQVDRLAAHPSLAGWLVNDHCRTGDRIADRLHTLDPTRFIFRNLPQAS